MSVLCKVERFLRQTSMPATKFGRLSLNDPRLVEDLRRGREPRPRTAALIEAKIAELDREIRP
ncbi:MULTISPECIES: hypothetical protein [unclassified Sphingomonas]|uniref:hypothetical protein n=1 Tax=unclassified Sphingomonas TaxID=196159 RepID=UPI000BDCCE69|nr:MAG: hypothetical protein B7Z43_08025 [Sphingomonas sp. 12-62-6]OYX38878.1 MAG: hypothetical protein B7Y98_07100 [Sphingomonas sp. 32-62-10]OYY65236.1 MAG: hypothetical protein B7Y49_07090 [Sphingomonas sp. 28-62-11]